MSNGWHNPLNESVPCLTAKERESGIAQRIQCNHCHAHYLRESDLIEIQTDYEPPLFDYQCPDCHRGDYLEHVQVELCRKCRELEIHPHYDPYCKPCGKEQQP